MFGNPRMFALEAYVPSDSKQLNKPWYWETLKYVGYPSAALPDIERMRRIAAVVPSLRLRDTMSNSIVMSFRGEKG